MIMLILTLIRLSKLSSSLLTYIHTYTFSPSFVFSSFSLISPSYHPSSLSFTHFFLLPSFLSSLVPLVRPSLIILSRFPSLPLSVCLSISLCLGLSVRPSDAVYLSPACPPPPLSLSHLVYHLPAYKTLVQWAFKISFVNLFCHIKGRSWCH